jgi:penicillin-binding protein 2
MEQDSGRILAMASSPTYSPNLFDPENTNSIFISPFSSPNGAVINRAINGQYPLGSVFKIITMAAALESGVFTAEDTYDCQYQFTDLLPSGPILYDWTFERNQRTLEEDGIPYSPSGLLTLPQGLMRSCNPWFYHIGLTLFNEGLTTALSDMARGFGLGSPTGLIGVPGESEGRVDDPGEPLDATNLATGQGDLLVTPIQVAKFVAAVANGGTFYVPQAIERIEDPEGNTLYQFSPQTSGELPVSQETIAEVQDAMKLVTQNPRGTAEFAFRNFSIEVGGKTGTAQSGLLDPHAWFAAYTDENREDKPDIVVVVVVENIGDGSEWAAPVARRVIENYYFNRIIRGYPWEIRIGVPGWLAFDEPVDE